MRSHSLGRLLLVCCVTLLGVTGLASHARSQGLCGVFYTYKTIDTVNAVNLNGNIVQASTTNSTPQCVQGNSASLTQMQATVDPYPGQVESLATSLEGELQRLRFVITQATGWTQWYTYNLGITPTIRGYPKASLPAASTAGRLARVTDNARGVWMDQGSQWFGLSGEVVNVKEFGATGDGATNDTTAIAAAFTAAGSGRVYFPAGTYLTDPITIGSSNLEVFGAGMEQTTIKLRPQAAGTSNTITATDKTFLHIHDLTLDGNRDATTSTGTNLVLIRATNSIVERNHSKNTDVHGILISSGNPAVAANASRVIVRDNVVDTFDSFGIVLFQVDDSLVTGNLVITTGSGTTGILLDDQEGAGSIGAPLRNQVLGNRILGNSLANPGIDLSGARGTVVAGNTVYQAKNWGIAVRGGAAASGQASDYTIVSGNVVEATATGSSIPAAFYVSASQVIFVGNQAKENAGTAVAGFLVGEVFQSGGAPSNIVFDSNSVGGNAGIPFSVRLGTHIRIANNTIAGNSVNVNGEIRAFALAGAITDLEIVGNNINGAYGPGIAVSSRSQGAVSDVAIRNNRILNVSLGTSNTNDAVELTQTTLTLSRVRVSGNDIRDNQGSPTGKSPLSITGTLTAGLFESNQSTGLNSNVFAVAGAVTRFNNTLQANLGTPSNGSVEYCSDCTIANPCAGGGTGALAKYLNATWVCN